MKIKANKFLQHGAWLVVGTLSGQLASKAALSTQIINHDSLQSPLGIGIGFLGSYIGICMARIYIDSIKKDNHDDSGNIKGEKDESLIEKELEYEAESSDFFNSKPPKIR